MTGHFNISIELPGGTQTLNRAEAQLVLNLLVATPISCGEEISPFAKNVAASLADFLVKSTMSDGEFTSVEFDRLAKITAFLSVSSDESTMHSREVRRSA